MGTKTNKRRYFCHSCGGVTVWLTPEQAEVEIKEGHEIELWSEIEKKAEAPQ